MKNGDSYWCYELSQIRMSQNKRETKKQRKDEQNYRQKLRVVVHCSSQADPWLLMLHSRCRQTAWSSWHGLAKSFTQMGDKYRTPVPAQMTTPWHTSTNACDKSSRCWHCFLTLSLHCWLWIEVEFSDTKKKERKKEICKSMTKTVLCLVFWETHSGFGYKERKEEKKLKKRKKESD